MAFEAEVIVVGAGPSGCLLTLRLIRQGIRVALIEQEVEIQPHFRALGYPGCTHAALEKAGIWEDVKGKGFIKRGFSWRRLPRDDVMGGSEKIWGDLIATWDPYINSPLRDGDVGHGMLALPQNRFREIIMPKILASDLAAVFLGHTAVELRQNSTSATVTVVNSVGSVTEITGAFLVGADGGKSVIRKQLGLHLNGFTWNQIVVAVDMLINLPPPKDGPSSLYYVDPVDFAFFSVIEKPSGPGPILWRCTLIIREEESHPDMFDKTLKQKLDKLTPGPRPLKYQLLRAQQYRIHQRSSETMKKGRCLLVGDAAHLTNPWGGLGLTTGILDVDSLADVLDGIFKGQTSESVLDAWSDARLNVFNNIVSPTATKNFKRCYEVDPQLPLLDPLFKAIHENSDGLKCLNQGLAQLVTDVKLLVAQ
ncbi:uncharacterized protein N7473_004213 [Penicillium subrubescens]|uniref:Para-nitrophenol 4-monooxygenase n=1 Tax=Penicillium subrubescens TaxID=1316194 RepID=A0A1Q5UIC6_9EURO|nr:uncharacterized protein N7473_004213 [Penicillium subrubescens]KAJ5907297.1 hypothetical protein N7473_004213 [Penicillium subrubescens]OKP12214.1 Para-nitrophenol 4-monooxygenase [Penicillium subrubescens]